MLPRRSSALPKSRAQKGVVLLKKETANLVIGIAMLVIPFATLMLKIIEVARS